MYYYTRASVRRNPIPPGFCVHPYYDYEDLLGPLLSPGPAGDNEPEGGFPARACVLESAVVLVFSFFFFSSFLPLFLSFFFLPAFSSGRTTSLAGGERSHPPPP